MSGSGPFCLFYGSPCMSARVCARSALVWVAEARRADCVLSLLAFRQSALVRMWRVFSVGNYIISHVGHVSGLLRYVGQAGVYRSIY